MLCSGVSGKEVLCKSLERIQQRLDVEVKDEYKLTEMIENKTKMIPLQLLRMLSQRSSALPRTVR